MVLERIDRKKFFGASTPSTQTENPFKKADELLQIALVDLKSGKDTEAIRKLKEYRAEHSAITSQKKCTLAQKTAADLNLFTCNSLIEKILERQAAILAILFETTGLRSQETLNSRNKALSELKISDSDKNDVLKQAFVIAQVNEALNNISDIREIVVFTEEHGLLAERLGLLQGSPPARYDGLSIFDKATELFQKITAQDINTQSSIHARSISDARTGLTESNHNPDIAIEVTATAPHQNVVSLFINEIVSPKKEQSHSPKGSKVNELIGSNVSQESDVIKFIQALATESIISLDEEYRALLQIAGDPNIAREISNFNFDILDKGIKDAICGQKFDDQIHTSRPAKDLYEYLQYFIDPLGKRKNNFQEWAAIEREKREKLTQAKTVNKFHSNTHNVNSETFTNGAKEDFNLVIKLIDKACSDRLIGSNTSRLLESIITDPASVNEDFRNISDKRQRVFAAEVSKVASTIDITYGSLINTVNHYVLESEQQQGGGVVSTPTEGISNLAVALKVSSEDLQRFLLKRGIISEQQPVPSPVSQVYSAFKQATWNNFETLCRNADLSISCTNKELRTLVEEIIGNEEPFAKESPFQKLVSLASKYYDATEPTKQPQQSISTEPIVPTVLQAAKPTISAATIVSVKSPFMTKLAEELGIKLPDGSLPTREELQAAFNDTKNRTQKVKLMPIILQLGKRIPFIVEYADGNKLEIFDPKVYAEIVHSSNSTNNNGDN